MIKNLPCWHFNSQLNLLTLFIFYLLNRAGAALTNRGWKEPGNPPLAQHMKGKHMPKITIDTQQVITTRFNFDHLIWQIIYQNNPEKLVLGNWYAKGGISDKIEELWELIKGDV